MQGEPDNPIAVQKHNLHHVITNDTKFRHPTLSLEQEKKVAASEQKSCAMLGVHKK